MEYILRQKNEECEETKARMAFKPGMTLYGYCNGVFGRDSYHHKKILEVHVNNLVVSEDGHIFAAEVSNWVDLLNSSNRSLKEEEEEVY